MNPFLVLAAVVGVNLLVQAGLLLLAVWVCRAYREHRPGYVQALTALVLIALLDLGLLYGWMHLALDVQSRQLVLIGLVTASTLVYILIAVTVLRLPWGRGALASGLAMSAGVLFSLGYIKAAQHFADAFVIPTGAMADTLRGFHKVVKCPSCGYSFAVNASREAEPLEGRETRVNGCVCPNCRRVIRLVNPMPAAQAPNGWSDGRGPRAGIQKAGETEYVEVADPGISGGDRIFMLRSLLAGKPFPQRMDLVVFKFPPKEEERYVKRVVGLPGETVAIHGGDFYLLDPDDGPKYEEPFVPAEDRWNWEFMHSKSGEEARKFFESEKFRILRKSPEQVLDLMQPVHDNEFLASDLKADELARWRPDKEEWEASDGGRTFRRTPRKDDEGWLRYRHVLRGSGGKPALVSDSRAYNGGGFFEDRPEPFGGGSLRQFAPDGMSWVGDLILECEVTVEKAEGTFTLELVRAGERFRAVWDLASGSCELRRQVGEGESQKLGAAATNLKQGTHRVRFANVDRNLIVWVDDELPFKEGVQYSISPDAPPTAEDLKPVGVGCARADVTVRKLRVLRDIHYSPEAGGFDRELHDPSDPVNWEALKNRAIRTMYVQPGHYLCFGDNPNASSDSRTWGAVPERLLLGKVALVYYPWSRPVVCDERERLAHLAFSYGDSWPMIISQLPPRNLARQAFRPVPPSRCRFPRTR